jgi:iron(III) transport system substrate-binding protein
VNPEVDPAPLLASFGDYQGQQIDAAAYGVRNADAVQLLARAGYE